MEKNLKTSTGNFRVYHSGASNSGNFNLGYRNSGNYNSGNYNSGNYNSGNYNSGHYNSGHDNLGHYNSGHDNSGNYNSGHDNSGNYNSGHYNSGNFNSGNGNGGFFNTDTPDKIRLFNKWIDMSFVEFMERHNVYANIPLNTWIRAEDMTEYEKSKVANWEIRGGYLKTLSYKKAWEIWWENNPKRHEDFLSLPNFDPKIFEQITGIKTN